VADKPIFALGFAEEGPEPVLVIVTPPVEAETLIPVPAVRLVTPVLVTVFDPRLIPVPALNGAW
jgi:hypothetical protein